MKHLKESLKLTAFGMLVLGLSHACEAQAEEKPAPVPPNALCATFPRDGVFLETMSNFSSVYSARHRACFKVGNEVQCWELFGCTR